MRARAGTGKSGAKDAYEAGKEAAAEAAAKLGGEPPALVLVFTMPHYDLNRLLEGVRSITGAARLAGATGSGELVDGEYMGFGAGVAVLAVSAGRYRFGLGSASDIAGDLEGAGRTITQEAKAQAGISPHSAIILLADCMAGDLQKLFLGAYKVAGARTTIVGGAAGDELRFTACYVFRDGEVIEKGAVAVWIASEQPLKVATRHGWRPLGVPLLVTKARGTEIQEVAGRPAADTYEKVLGIAPGELPPDRFWDTSMYHPFGLLQMDGSTVIRVARAKTESGSLMIQACVPPEGSAVQVMEGDADSLLAVVGEVGREAVEGVREACAVLAFSCAMRAKILKDRTPEEARILREAVGGLETFGIYCCGEFARTAGSLGTHNATLTLLAL